MWPMEQLQVRINLSQGLQLVNLKSRARRAFCRCQAFFTRESGERRSGIVWKEGTPQLIAVLLQD